MTKRADEQFADRGLSIQPVVGLRTFKVDVDGCLTGLYYPQRWHAGENIATCLKGGYVWGEPTAPLPNTVDGGTYPDHPVDECSHGFYAYYDGSKNFRQQGVVHGVVLGYGREVFVGSKGFRAMKAMILGLSFGPGATDEIREMVSAAYAGIPFAPDVDTLIDWFPPDGGDLSASAPKKDS